MDILSCYKGVIPFYRCNNTKDILIHHSFAISLLSLTTPSIFNIYNSKINNLLNTIISHAFVSSLNEAIMIYGTSFPVSKSLMAVELLYKIYLFSFNAILNSYYKIKLFKNLEYKFGHIPLYLLIFGSGYVYFSMYTKLLKASVYKFKLLIK